MEKLRLTIVDRVPFRFGMGRVLRAVLYLGTLYTLMFLIGALAIEVFDTTDGAGFKDFVIAHILWIALILYLLALPVTIGIFSLLGVFGRTVRELPISYDVRLQHRLRQMGYEKCFEEGDATMYIPCEHNPWDLAGNTEIWIQKWNEEALLVKARKLEAKTLFEDV